MRAKQVSLQERGLEQQESQFGRSLEQRQYETELERQTGEEAMSEQKKQNLISNIGMGGILAYQIPAVKEAIGGAAKGLIDIFKGGLEGGAAAVGAAGAGVEGLAATTGAIEGGYAAAGAAGAGAAGPAAGMSTLGAAGTFIGAPLLIGSGLLDEPIFGALGELGGEGPSPGEMIDKFPGTEYSEDRKWEHANMLKYGAPGYFGRDKGWNPAWGDISQYLESDPKTFWDKYWGKQKGYVHIGGGMGRELGLGAPD
jgi:hypothetical protein